MSKNERLPDDRCPTCKSNMRTIAFIRGSLGGPFERCSDSWHTPTIDHDFVEDPARPGMCANCAVPAPPTPPRQLAKNRTVSGGKEFWDHVEKVSAGVDDMVKSVLGSGEPSPSPAPALDELVTYFEKRAAENEKRINKPVPADRTSEWHAGKADTYKRCADKLREVLAAPSPLAEGQAAPTDAHQFYAEQWSPFPVPLPPEEVFKFAEKFAAEMKAQRDRQYEFSIDYIGRLTKAEAELKQAKELIQQLSINICSPGDCRSGPSKEIYQRLMVEVGKLK